MPAQRLLKLDHQPRERSNAVLKDMLIAEDLWHTILLQLVKELATQSADKVAAKYAAGAAKLVKSQNVTKPADVVRVTLNFVEQKQGWSNTLVKTALFLKGTTRSKEKAKLAEAALARVNQQHLTDPAAIVAATIAVVRAKQDWDSVTSRLAGGG
jgi:hypothetical protein